MKTKNIYHVVKPYDFGKAMPHKMEHLGKFGAILGGSLAGIWNPIPDPNFLMVGFAAAAWFIIKFVGGAFVGGMIGKWGGNFATKATEKYYAWLEKKKNKKQK